jgi:cysteine synthase B
VPSCSADDGNTGISLALVAKLKGLKLTCVMPANATPERRTLLELFGAEIIESPGDQGSNGAVRMAQEIAAREPRYTMLFQYENDANPRAHYEGTRAEIARDLGRLDAFVAGLAPGDADGRSRRLREAFPGVRVVAAEPCQNDGDGAGSLEDGYVRPCST